MIENKQKKMQKQIEKHKETKQNAKETPGKRQSKRQSIRQETVTARMRYPKQCQSVMFLTEWGVRAESLISRGRGGARSFLSLNTVSDFFEYFWLVYRVTPQEEQAIVPYRTI